MNQVPHSGPTYGRSHRTKYSRPVYLARESWSSMWRHISSFLLAASWTPSMYAVSLLLLSESRPDSPPVHLNPMYLVSFCQPFIITRHSTWLSKCSTSPNLPAGTTALLSALWSTNVPTRNICWRVRTCVCVCARTVHLLRCAYVNKCSRFTFIAALVRCYHVRSSQLWTNTRDVFTAVANICTSVRSH